MRKVRKKGQRKNNQRIRRNVLWMKRLCGTVSIVLAIFLLFPAATQAAIALGTPVSAACEGCGNTPTLSIPSVVISGSNRALVVGICLNDNDDQRVSSVVLDPAGENFPLDWLDSAAGDIQDDGYCVIFGKENPPTGTFSVVVTLGADTQGNEALIAGAWPLTGVDQNNPFGTAIGNSGISVNGAQVTVSSAVNDLVLGAGWSEYYSSGNTITTSGTGTEDWKTTGDGGSSSDTSAAQHKDGEATSTTLTWTNNSDPEDKWATIGVAVKPATVDSTIIGDGTDPSNVTIAPGAAITDLDAFTLEASTGTDTVTAVTVTLGPAGAFNNIGQADITNTSNVAQCTAITNPGSNTLSFTGCSISVTTTATTFKVRITPKTHANMPAVPGASYAVTGTITAFTSTNTQAGIDSLAQE